VNNSKIQTSGLNANKTKMKKKNKKMKNSKTMFTCKTNTASATSAVKSFNLSGVKRTSSGCWTQQLKCSLKRKIKS